MTDPLLVQARDLLDLANRTHATPEGDASVDAYAAYVDAFIPMEMRVFLASVVERLEAVEAVSA